MKPILSHEGRDYFSEAELKARVAEIHLEHEGEEITGAAKDEWNRCNEVLDQFEKRRERILELARSGRVESGDGASFRPGYLEQADDSVPVHVRASRDAGLRTIERHQHALNAEASDRLDGLLRHDDPAGFGARYLAAVGNPHYKTAFVKILSNPDTAHLMMSREEQLSVQEVVAAEEARAMGVGSGATGGFGIPIEIDPTITLEGAGALNPVRQYATVRPMSTLQLRLVSADQVAANYAAEAAEVADSSPTLTQPTLTAARGQAFIPYSIETEQDYTGLAQELTKILADARANLDNTSFLTGSGTNAPQGVLTGLSSASWRVQTATIAVTAIADAYSFKNALPARHLPNAVFAAHPSVFDVFFRFVGGGSTEPPVLGPSLGARDGKFLGYDKFEWTAMASTTTVTGTKIMIAGDWKAGFVIGDRIGAQLEIVRHLFGPANRFPTGQRGGYFFWRTGSAVVSTAANAPLRWLEVK
jgi:HK97 family phage major capsid protein